MWATGVDIREDPFPGRGESDKNIREDPFPGRGESDKNVHSCSRNLLTVTDKSQQNLRIF